MSDGPLVPLAAVLPRENRQFLARAVGYVARQGVTQFIDVPGHHARWQLPYPVYRHQQ